MDKYQVKINPRAIRELNSIYEYIANKKLKAEKGIAADEVTDKSDMN